MLSKAREVRLFDYEDRVEHDLPWEAATATLLTKQNPIGCSSQQC